MKKYQRKMVVFGVTLIVAILATFFMKIEFYGKFLDAIVMIAVGFFAGNGLEHIGEGLSKKNGE